MQHREREHNLGRALLHGKHPDAIEQQRVEGEMRQPSVLLLAALEAVNDGAGAPFPSGESATVRTILT